jgi:hypothetical protein
MSLQFRRLERVSVRNAVGQRYQIRGEFRRPGVWRPFRGSSPPRTARSVADVSRRRRRRLSHLRLRRDLASSRFRRRQRGPLFFLGFNADGEAVAGVRFHGPLESSHQANMIEEMAAAPDIADIAALIDSEVRFGALEVKGAWSKGEAVVGQRLAVALARCWVHAMNWLGAEFSIAAVADRLLAVAASREGCKSARRGCPFPMSATAPSPWPFVARSVTK